MKIRLNKPFFMGCFNSNKDKMLFAKVRKNDKISLGKENT